jgi:predicted dinucleotide-binding enzyme
MKVGVLGSGIVGQVLGGGFAKHGHQVMMGTRDPKAESGPQLGCKDYQRLCRDFR